MTIHINSRVEALVDFFEPTQVEFVDLDWSPSAGDKGSVVAITPAKDDHPALYEIRFDDDIDADEDHLSWTYLATEIKEIDA